MIEKFATHQPLDHGVISAQSLAQIGVAIVTINRQPCGTRETVGDDPGRDGIRLCARKGTAE